MKKTLSIALLAALLLVALSGCSLFGGSGGTTLGVAETRDTYVEADSGYTIYPVGNTASFKGFDITLKSVVTTSRVNASGNQYYYTEDGESFVVCTFDVTNKGTEAASLLSMIDFSNSDCYFYALEWDYYYAFDDDMTLDSSDLYNNSIEPGETVEGTLSFIVEDVDLEGPEQWYVQFYTEASSLVEGSEDEMTIFTIYAA